MMEEKRENLPLESKAMVAKSITSRIPLSCGSSASLGTT
jgi:hypothetical protein